MDNKRSWFSSPFGQKCKPVKSNKMKKQSIILACALVAVMSCTKSKEVHPEIGDGNDEIVTVGTNVYVKYTRTDVAELNKVVFHYSPAGANSNAQQYESTEMTKKETFFELTLNNLLSDTLYGYYYELFPNNGSVFATIPKTFRTLENDIPEPPTPPTPPTPPSDAPEGAINGLFSVNANGDQVYFSKGNLQYIGSATIPYWKLADHQWDYLGYTGGQSSDSPTADRDLFGWGTSGWHDNSDPYNLYYQPWSITTTWSSHEIVNENYNFFGYGPSTNMQSPNLTGNSANYDWGYNSIVNGGNSFNIWRTLTIEEWVYVLETRTTVSNIHYAKAIVSDVKGTIVLPDDWYTSYYPLNNTNKAYASYSSNTITSEQWNTLEQHGAIFLPAGGFRSGGYIEPDAFDFGYYWSASYNGSSFNAYHVYFGDASLNAMGNYYRCMGLSVRLVQDASK